MEQFYNMPNQASIRAVPLNSTVRLYSGVPWDNTYRHVRLYSSKADLLSHLGQWQVRSLSGLAPVKLGKLEVRVPYSEMEMLNVNYMAFQNPAYSSEWVFAFVTAVEWLSDRTTRISYELDVFQNNFYSVNVKPCFVEYHHIPKSQDYIGANQNPVNIETGEPVSCYHRATNFGPMYICFQVTSGTQEGSQFEGIMRNNVYTPFRVWSMKADDDGVSAANDLINTYNESGKLDAIVLGYMAPELATQDTPEEGPSEVYELTFDIPDDCFGGYVPRNNKLYTYPFCYILADNNEGQSSIYRFELFDSPGTATFHSYGVENTMPGILTMPADYKGVPEYLPEAMTNVNFPQIAWTADSYQAYTAQNKATIALRGVSAISGLVGGAVMAGAAGAGGAIGASQGFGSLGSVLGLVSEQMDKYREPPLLRGKTSNENINAGMELCRVDFYVMTCQRQFAEQIDDFFSAYGYPINQVTMPNLNSRQSWNFVKTNGCGFTGAVDLAQLSALRNIFDSGVTIWHTDDVGNYGLPNN